MGRSRFFLGAGALMALSLTSFSGHTLVPEVPKVPRLKERAQKTAEVKKDNGEIKNLTTPNQAILLAWEDVKRLPPAVQPLVRYLWLTEGTIEDLKTTALTINVINRAPTGIRPVPVGGILARIHLDQYAPREQDLVDWLKFWEDLQFDPYFSVFITKDQIEFAQKALGITINQEQSEQFNQIDVIRINGPHLDEKKFLELQLLTKSQAPVVSDGYFAHRVLTTVKDKGLYATLFGGRYYEFAGIRKAKDTKGKEKATDLALFLEDRGVGNIAGGLDVDKLFDTLRSDQRVAMFRSEVTGKPRRVDWFHGPDSRNGTGAISITHDFRDQDIDIKTHPIMNLINIEAKAYEVIAETGNGMHRYALFDDKQKLLDEAAPDVAVDRTVPSPNSARLQSGISCIACHETEGSDGWKPLRNDVKRMVAGRLDIFADISKFNTLQSDVIQRAAGLYAGDFTKHLRRGRDDYAETILKISGPWPQSVDQTDVVKVGMTKVVNKTRGWYYDMVTPEQALKELGYRAPKDKVLATLNSILPPDPQGRVGDVYLEDPRIGALKEGVSIPRWDWSLVYGYAAARVSKTMKAMGGNTK